MITQPSRLLAAVAVTKLLRVSSCMPQQEFARVLAQLPKQ